MCAVVPVVMAITAALSAAMAVKSSNDQKHALEAQATLQQHQADQSAQAQTMDRMQAARQARASARAAAAESGVSGNSSDAVLNDIMMQESRDVTRIELNRENGMAATAQEIRSRTGEINGQLTASLVGSASQAAQAGYAGYKSNYIPSIDKSVYTPRYVPTIQ
jgi:hypothetical protein